MMTMMMMRFKRFPFETEYLYTSRKRKDMGVSVSKHILTLPG